MLTHCDSFGGEVVLPGTFEDPKKAEAFDLMAMLGRNSKERRQPEIFACAKALKEEHGFKKVGAVGFMVDGLCSDSRQKVRLQPRQSQMECLWGNQ